MAALSLKLCHLKGNSGTCNTAYYTERKEKSKGNYEIKERKKSGK
jgi:hypothetical protein